MPALFTAQSRPPKRSTASVDHRGRRRRRRRRRPRPRPRCPRSCAWCPSPRPASMSATTTLAPCWPNELRDRAADAASRTGDERDLAARSVTALAPLEIRRRCARPDRSPRSGSHVASASTASTIVSIGSTISSGRSIIAVAPSVRTAARGATAFTAMPSPRSSIANDCVSRSSAALLGAYVDERACCGLSVPGRRSRS